MTRKNYQRAKELFLEVCSLDESARARMLDGKCADDQALRAEVESLLAHHRDQTLLASTVAHRLGGGWDSRFPTSTVRRAARLVMHEVRERRWLYLAATLALAILLAGGIWSHYGVEYSLRRVLHDELQTVLNADVTALELWLSEQQSEAKRWARQDELAAAVAELARIARESPPADVRDRLLASRALAELRDDLHGYIEEEKGHAAYSVIDRSGLVLAAREDVNVGIHLNAEGMADNSYVFAGETRVARPHPQGSFVLDRHVDLDVPMIWIGTPVRDGENGIVASLNLGVNADDQFTRILSVARVGDSGETYAFDDQGWFLSDSRFTDDLKAAGLIPNRPDARAIFNLKVHDPGGDVTRGYRPQLPHERQPLTKMVEQATAGFDDVDVEGYRDYRGIKVIGAWRWLEDYGFGVVTEVDYDEAYAPLRYPIIASWLPLGVLVLAAGGLCYSAMRIAGLQRAIGVARQLGQYTLEEKIGEGGMGVVYRARHAMLRRPTAVKLLKPDHMTAMAIARFEREVQLASQLTHPNTIEIYDFGQTADGVFYYAMEYLPGVSLAQLIQIEGTVSPARTVYILKQICGSLAEAHGIGLVHRDIKPQNIMLCERGGMADFVKVLDFGLVKSVEEDKATNLTASNVLTGTPLYMPPERLKGSAANDPRSDLYSLGAVGYNLLTGRCIFTCATELDVLFHVMNVVPPAPAVVNPAIPDALSKLIESCLAKDPQARPRSAAELLEALDNLDGLGTWTEADARAWWHENGAAVQSVRNHPGLETVDATSQATAAHGA